MVANLDLTPLSIDPTEREAADAVESLRTSLRTADVEGAQRARWLAPRPPGERDLLSDLAAAEGLERAVRRLSRFWRRAEARLEHVRMIGALEAEVYERLTLPGASLPIVSLVRRPSADAPWRVVCTTEAHDERLTLWLVTLVDRVDDVSWSRAFERRFGGAGELVMDGTSGVLGDARHGWLAHVRGPAAPPEPWPEHLPGEGGRVLEIAAALAPDAADRRAQLDWVLRAAAVFVEQLEVPSLYVPAHDKLILPGALAAAVRGSLGPDQAVRFWARIEEAGSSIVTSGLRQLGLPEIEAGLDLLDEPGLTARLVRWVAARSIEAGRAPNVGTDLTLGARVLTVVEGGRGPRPGASHGRWGAIRIVADVGARDRGSRRRIRVPETLG